MMRLALSENSFLFKRGYAFYHEKKIKNLIICINTGTLSNMNENTKEIYH